MSAPAIISSGTAAGGPPVGGSGTTNTIPRWTGTSTLGDAGITDNGSTVSFVGRNITAPSTAGGASYVLAPTSGQVFGQTVGSSVWYLGRTTAAGAAVQPDICVNNSGNVGIGTATPSSPGTIQGTYSATVPQLLVRDSVGANGALWLTANSAGQAATLRAGPVTGGYGFMIYDSFSHTFRSSGNDAMVITDTRNVGIGTASPVSRLDIAGTITCDDAGTGLKLPATPGNTDPNTLDCYADGGTADSGGVTWTPTLTFDGLSTGVTYATRVGRYTRIGNMIYATAYISLTSKGTATGDARIAGLPTSSNTAGLFPAAAIGTFANITTSGQLCGYMSPNTTAILLNQVSAAGAVTNMKDTNFTNTSGIAISICYPVT